MSHLRSSLCIFCQHSRASTRSTPLISSSQSRSYAQLQKKLPSRMVLSPKEEVGRNRSRRNPSSPWAATNLTEARLRPDLKPSAADQKRKDRKVNGGRGREERNDKPMFKALKMQQALSQVSYGRRNATKSRMEGLDTFDDFRLLPSIKESIAAKVLPGMVDLSPSPIQKLAIPALLGEKRRGVEKTETLETFLLAAETGSGKTLAYVLPIVDALKRFEQEEKIVEAQEEATKAESEKSRMFELESPPLSSDMDPKAGKPRVIILVPTAELVEQVGGVIKALSHGVKYRSAIISSTYSGVVIRNRLFRPEGIDVLVSTPHLLASICQSNPSVLSQVRHLVIDEADSLFDRSFRDSTTAVLDRAKPTLKQMIFCSATIPKWLDGYLRKCYPDMRRLTTPNLHAIPRRVQLGVVDVDRDPYRGNKDLACADTIYSIGKSISEHDPEDGRVYNYREVKRIVVFVNEREQTVQLANFLVSKGIDAVAFSRDTEARKQAEILATFTGQQNGTESEEDAKKRDDSTGAFRLKHAKVLVVTDIASRGIDTTAVRHVILYDVPHTTIDFIHRLGRVGRMGRRGRGVVLVGRNDRKDVVREVREGMFKGQALI